MRLPLTIAAALTSAALLAGCGSSSDEKKTTAKTTTTPKQATVRVVYATPDGSEAQDIGKTLLQAGGTTEVAKALAGNFALPWDMKVLVRAQSDAGPHYNPQDHSINLDYAFSAFIYDKVKAENPDISDYDLGKTVAAINSFIYVHEFAHLLIDAFDLPITGREEDAADQLAAQFMVKFVDGGDEYAFDAAQFFESLARDPGELDESDFFDEHALDQQRAYQIVCWIAGSSQENYDAIEQAEIFSQDRLARCPEEWEQVDRAWTTLLAPHYRKDAGEKKTTTAAER